MSSKLNNSTNPPRKAPPKRGRKNQPSTHTNNPADETTQNLLARVAQFESAAIARDEENVQLQAQLAMFMATQGQSLAGLNRVVHPIGQENMDPRLQQGRLERAQNDTTTTAENLFNDIIGPENHQPVVNSQAPSTLLINTNSHRKMIPRPKGQAGKDYCLAAEMGLAKSRKAKKKYNTLLNEWARIPAEGKVMLFGVMREHDPFLNRFEQDWASKAMVRQYIKNKHKPLYQNGTLKVANKYKYLKANATMQDQTVKRGKRKDGHSKNTNKDTGNAGTKNHRHLRCIVYDDNEETPKFIQGSSHDIGGVSLRCRSDPNATSEIDTRDGDKLEGNDCKESPDDDGKE
ncbi:hypothetical protein F5876DRAFT_82398 [Lentinula aff. lateritia]|uniref:Uncharacterized protein n=1 Tax=Lentinula aff. lateritia TaxID=2804960 RepID=A0ACC1TJJ1_9AGAR|nr:hypothetical protein F5876DRAFT_82398 [Lentinula aff. lateritia]